MPIEEPLRFVADADEVQCSLPPALRLGRLKRFGMMDSLLLRVFQGFKNGLRKFREFEIIQRPAR